jgi:hypothetical protein
MGAAPALLAPSAQPAGLELFHVGCTTSPQHLAGTGTKSRFEAPHSACAAQCTLTASRSSRGEPKAKTDRRRRGVGRRFRRGVPVPPRRRRGPFAGRSSNFVDRTIGICAPVNYVAPAGRSVLPPAARASQRGGQLDFKRREYIADDGVARRRPTDAAAARRRPRRSGQSFELGRRRLPNHPDGRPASSDPRHSRRRYAREHSRALSGRCPASLGTLRFESRRAGESAHFAARRRTANTGEPSRGWRTLSERRRHETPDRGP